MTFEEFFRKKKISLPLLKEAQPALFAEFEEHYEAMGEKSFDHTKKYWFNKLRRQYVLPAEPKLEKVIIENPLAEQTIVESLTEPVPDKPKVGFTPRFKAGTTTKTPDSSPDQQPASEEPKPEAIEKPKVGFTPRFKAGVTATKPLDVKPVEKVPEPDQKTDVGNPIPEEKPKPAFKPRFKPPQK